MIQLGLLCEKMILARLKQKTTFALMCFVMKTIYISNEKFENSTDILLAVDGDKSHYVYIRDFNRFMFHKSKNKNKKYFCRSSLQCFSSKNLLTEYKYKEVYWSINGARSVILENGTIEFENYFKQIPVPLKFDADFECNFKRVQRSLHKKYQDYISCSFAYKLICVDDDFTKPIVFFRGENAAFKFIETSLKEFVYCKNGHISHIKSYTLSNMQKKLG